MSNPVSKTPYLPNAGRAFDIPALNAFDQDLTKALFNALSEHARRINDNLPKDGSEPMTGRLDFQTNAVIRMLTAGGDFVVENSTGQDLLFIDDDWASFYYGDGTYRGGFAADGFEINASKTLRFGFGADFDEFFHDDTTNTWYITSDGAATRETTNTNATLNVGRVRLTNTTDAALASTDHPWQIGPSSGQNIIADGNEIMARNNGAAAELHVNAEGGDFRVNANDGSGGLIFRGGQIVFPATQNASSDANTLDDYEEGTWTPGITFGGGSTGMTFSVQSGFYVKVGKLVKVSLRLQFTAKGSSTGTAVVTGLPFSGESNSARTSSLNTQFYAAMASLEGEPIGLLSGTSATLRMYDVTGGAGMQTLNEGNFTDTTDLRMSAVYEATA